MKVVILAGGYGSRLGSITDLIPKPMVKVGNMPILWHIMKYYASFGHKDFILSLGYKAEIIKDFFYNYEAVANDFTVNLGSKDITIHNKHDESDWNVTLVDTGVDSLKGARIKRIEGHLDDVNLLTYGDGVSDVDIDALLQFHKSHGKIMTISGVRPPSRFGEIKVEDGKLAIFQEKAQTSVGMISGGFMVFNKELLNYLSTDENCDFETGPMNILVDKGEVMVFEHEGLWECVDNDRDLNHLNKLWKDGEAFWKKW